MNQTQQIGTIINRQDAMEDEGHGDGGGQTGGGEGGSGGGAAPSEDGRVSTSHKQAEGEPFRRLVG